MNYKIHNMDLIEEKIQYYAERHTSAENANLKKLNEETNANIEMPQMLSGHLQGRFLSMISRMIRPKQVLEIGTYTGYSALCLAEGLAEGGTIHTIDIDEQLKDMARRYFNEAGMADRIKLYTGNAMDIIPTIDAVFDIVFIDADKSNYLNYYDLVFDKVRKGGFIIADNVLWSGRVVDIQMDNRTKILDQYNKKVMSDDRVENILVPIRDGLMIAQKIV